MPPELLSVGEPLVLFSIFDPVSLVSRHLLTNVCMLVRSGNCTECKSPQRACPIAIRKPDKFRGSCGFIAQAWTLKSLVPVRRIICGEELVDKRLYHSDSGQSSLFIECAPVCYDNSWVGAHRVTYLRTLRCCAQGSLRPHTVKIRSFAVR